MLISLVISDLSASGGEGGFNPIDLATGGNVFWTLAIFGVSVPLIWKLVMGPVTKALAERDERSTEAIAMAEKASKAAAEAQAKLEATLREAQASAAKSMAEARERAEKRGADLVEAAKTEADALLENARKAIRAEQDKAIAAIKGQVVELSLRAATKVLERNVSSEDDRRFAAQVVAGERAARR
jgi:F-type H+-transporting ATPase subunit b